MLQQGFNHKCPRYRSYNKLQTKITSGIKDYAHVSNSTNNHTKQRNALRVAINHRKPNTGHDVFSAMFTQ